MYYLGTWSLRVRAFLIARASFSMSAFKATGWLGVMRHAASGSHVGLLGIL